MSNRSIKIMRVTNPNGTFSYRANYGGVNILTTTIEEARRIIVDMAKEDGLTVKAHTFLSRATPGQIVLDDTEANEVPWWMWPTVVEQCDALMNRMRTGG